MGLHFRLIAELMYSESFLSTLVSQNISQYCYTPALSVWSSNVMDISINKWSQCFVRLVCWWVCWWVSTLCYEFLLSFMFLFIDLVPVEVAFILYICSTLPLWWLHSASCHVLILYVLLLSKLWNVHVCKALSISRVGSLSVQYICNAIIIKQWIFICF